MLSVAFSGLGYGGVLCLLFPWLLTTPDARPLYPLGLIRLLIHAFLVAGFGLGLLSVLRRPSTDDRPCARHRLPAAWALAGRLRH